MNVWDLPWLEFAIAMPLVGAVVVSRIRDPAKDFRWGLAFTGCSLACACMGWLCFYWQHSIDEISRPGWILTLCL